MSAAAIRGIMGQACRRAGLKRVGAHRLRHTLATEMLRAGASLPEVGQVLRHRSTLATSIYAKVDDNALRVLARPWPDRLTEHPGPRGVTGRISLDDCRVPDRGAPCRCRRIAGSRAH